MDNLIAEINQRGKLYEDGYVGSDEEEEMPQAERDLAEDAQWKIFQKNTFTRWANEHLKQAQTSVNDIQTDFSDGIRLIRLVEVLSGQRFAHINKRPNFRTQKLENVTMVLKFLEENEGLKLVNIDSSDIVDSRLKLILGLIWTLILHYSISMPLWEGEEELPQDEKGKGPTPKQRILAWANSKMPDLPVKNLTTDWNNGIAIGALVDACAPGLCPDWDSWNPKSPLKNATEAMNAAGQWLEVPQLIMPEEMIDPKVDEKAMMTYLSQFPNAKLKDGAPLRPKINSARVKAYGPGLEKNGNTVNSTARFTVETFAAGMANLEVIVLTAGGAAIPCDVIKNEDRNLTYSCSYVPKTEGQYRIIIKFAGKEIPNSPFTVNVEGAPGDPKKVTVSGPGIDLNGGNCVGRRTFFNVFTKDAGNGLVACEVVDPNGRKDTIKPLVSRTDPDGPFLVEYTPKMEGQHQVIVLFGGNPIPGSPFPVNVGPPNALANAKLAEALKGQRPAVVKPNVASPATFSPKNVMEHPLVTQVPAAVTAAMAAPPPTAPPVDGVIHNDNNSRPVPPHGAPMAKPDPSKSGSACNPGLAYATGRGIQARGIRAQDRVSFHVHTERAGASSELAVELKRPDGTLEPVNVVKQSEHLYECTYAAQKPGQYLLSVTYGGGAIKNAPFKIIVGPYIQSGVRAFGPGLSRGIVKTPNKFTVVSNEEPGTLGFLIEGPSQAAIKCIDNGDTSAEVSYEVDMPGEYAIHVTCDDEDIQGSPFMAMVEESHNIDITQVKVFGKGISKTPGDVTKGMKTEFTVDMTPILPTVSNIAKVKPVAVKDLFHVECHDSLGEVVPVEITEVSNGVFTIKYTPRRVGTITVQMDIAGHNLRESGTRVPVGPEVLLNDIKLTGPGLESAKVKTATFFTIDLRCVPTPTERKALMNETVIHITNEDGSTIVPRVLDQQDGTFRVEYAGPETSTALCISVLVAGSQIGQSPYVVPVTPDFDVSKIKVSGLDSKVVSNVPQKFDIQLLGPNAPTQIPTVAIKDIASQVKSPAVVKKTNAGYDVDFTLPKPGQYTVGVACSNFPIAGPFAVEAVAPGQPIAPKGSQPAHVATPTVAPGAPIMPLVAAHNASLLRSGKLQEPVPLRTGTLAPLEINSPQMISLTKNPTANAPLQAPIPSKVAFVPASAIPTNEGVCLPERSDAQMQRLADKPFEIPLASSAPTESGQPIGSNRQPMVPGQQPFESALHQPVGHNHPFDQSATVQPVSSKLIPENKNPSQTISPQSHPITQHSQQSGPVAFDENQGKYRPDPLLVGPGIYRNPRPPVLPQEKEAVTQSSQWQQASPDEPAGAVVAYGPGLEKAMATKPAEFTIDQRKSTPGPLSVSIEGPKQAAVNCTDKGDQTCAVTYVPPVPGVYVINALYDGKKHIQGSPFMVQAYPVNKMDLNVDKVKAYGPGLEPNGVFKDSISKFVVDARDIDTTGQEPVAAIVKSPDGKRFMPNVVNRNDGTYLATYSAVMEGPHSIEVTYGGVQIPGSPFIANVSGGFDASRVHAYGPGLEPSGTHLQPNLKTHFTVDMSGAGKGGLGLSIEGPSDAAINCIDNGDGTCTVEYTPSMAGNHEIHISFNEVEIPMSPFHVRIQGDADVSRARCYGAGIEPGKVRANIPTKFMVDTRQVGDAPVEVTYTPTTGAAPIPALVRPVDNQPGVYECTYVPQAAGSCSIQVYIDGAPIGNAPITVNVKPSTEPDKVRVSGAGLRGPVQASLPSTFTIDATDAGSGDLSLNLTDPVGHSVPINVVSITPEELQQIHAAPPHETATKGPTGQPHDTGLLACTYKPFIVGEHKIHVMYAGSEIPDSPFVFESVPVGRAELCEIIGEVKPRIAVGDEACVTVHTANAAAGNLMCRATLVPTTGVARDLPVEVEDNGDGTVTAYFTPTEAGRVDTELRFGGQLIPNGKFSQNAVAADDFDITPIQADSQYNPVDFQLVVSGKEDQTLEAMVVRPSGVQEPVETKENNDGTMTVNYKPVERGMHELYVTTGTDNMGVRMPIKGSPFKFFVDNAASGGVTAHGPGLSYGVTGQPAEFTVVMKDAGAGGLSVSVEGPSKAEINCQDNGDGTCKVTYYPLVPGEYAINLKFMDKPISGSPFVAKITGEPKKRTQMSMSSMSCVSFDAGPGDISLLTATVTSPSGVEESCILKKLPENRMGISFTPKEYGDHLVNVFKAGKHIPKSPFHVKVAPEDVGDPSRVRVIWPERVQPTANMRNEFIVDSKNAGYATLGLSIEGPSKAEIDCTDNNDGTCTVGFCPTEPGTYVANVRYADQHVPGSPFTLQVGGEASARMVQRIVRSRQALEATQVGSRCGLTMRLPGDIRGISSEVLSPSGQRLESEIVPIDNEQFTIRFVPLETGIHTVSILNRGVHITGSPFQFTVGQPVDGGADKVRVSGTGLEYGEVNEINEFSIYTREAGAGGLSIAVEGPSKAEISFKDQQDGSCSVFYKVRRPGEYLCSIKFKDEHIPFSPFHVFIADPREGGKSEAYEVPIQYTNTDNLRSERDSLLIGRPVTFTVHCLDDDHVLVATVETPSQNIEEASVCKLDGDQHVVRFTPHESGTHFVRVFLIPQAEAHLGPRSPRAKEIDGSPFHVVVCDNMADPGTVYATGKGLTHGTVGVKNKFFVNTANSGVGLLSVVIDGPSKVQVTCEEQENGYLFSYVPTMPGEYKISIKYGGNFEIYGSPFSATITGAPMTGNPTISTEQSSMVFNTATKTMASRAYDASSSILRGIAQNVTSSGLGLKRGVVGKTNEFYIDASKAGNAMLLAGMSGPTHPCEQFKIIHNGNNRFSVTYIVQEIGVYWLSIMWGDQHIPGSPFHVDVPE